MSKYDALWAWIRENGTDSFNLTFAEIKQIAGVSIDHSFLASKKELMGYVYASLPAVSLYEHRGYKTVGHGFYELKNNVRLVCDIIEKNLE